MKDILKNETWGRRGGEGRERARVVRETYRLGPRLCIWVPLPDRNAGDFKCGGYLCKFQLTRRAKEKLALPTTTELLTLADELKQYQSFSTSGLYEVRKSRKCKNA